MGLLNISILISILAISISIRVIGFSLEYFNFDSYNLGSLLLFSLTIWMFVDIHDAS